jgi:hypothetical protein
MTEREQLNDYIVNGLKNVRPERWDRWIEAGHRGQKQAKHLALLVEASKDVALCERLSDFVKQCIQRSGLTVSDASHALGVSLNDGFQILDQATYSTLGATESLNLDPKYVRLALQWACFPGNNGPVVQVASPIDLSTEDETWTNGTLAKSDETQSDTPRRIDLDVLSSWVSSRALEANADEKRQLDNCNQVIEQYSR